MRFIATIPINAMLPIYSPTGKILGYRHGIAGWNGYWEWDVEPKEMTLAELHAASRTSE